MRIKINYKVNEMEAIHTVLASKNSLKTCLGVLSSSRTIAHRHSAIHCNQTKIHNQFYVVV